MKSIYISTKGNDCNDGSRDLPLATFGKALEMYATYQHHDTELLFMDGDYYLDKTVVIHKDYEPAEGATLRIACDKGANVTLSGAVRLNAWERLDHEKNIWQCNLPALPTGKNKINALYKGSTLLPRSSSHPKNRNDPNKQKNGYKTTNESCASFPTDFCTTKKARTELHFPEGSLENLSSTYDVEVYISPQRPWLVNYLEIESIDIENRIAVLNPQATYELIGSFTLENHIELITEPGEWAVDSKAGKIYYMPNGDSPGDDIFAPVLDELIRIEGNNDLGGTGDNPVRGIHIEGLILKHCDREVWKAEDKGLQHDWAMWDKSNALIHFRGAADCSVINCVLESTGGDGIRLDLYCRNIEISSNYIHHTGAMGIILVGYGPGYKDVNKENTILNNRIHHTGTLYPHSMGIFIWQSGHNRVAHNHIYELGYMGIVLSGVRRRFWDEKIRPRDIRELIPLIDFKETSGLEGGKGTWDNYEPFMHCRDNVIEYNEIHDCMQRLGDGNTIYLSGTGSGNVVRTNLLYNHHKNFLIRTDDDQFDSLWEKNILIGSSENPRGFTHKGRNAYNNNLLINCVAAVYTGVHGPSEGINSIRNNIFYYEGEINGELLVDNSNFSKGTVEKNIFFSKNLEVQEKYLRKRHEKESDIESKAANPKFRDLTGLDFTLEDDSPALALGTEQIDYMKIGQLNDPAVVRLRNEGTLKRGWVSDTTELNIG